MTRIMPHLQSNTVNRRSITVFIAVLIAGLMLAGCSNSKLRRTPTTERPTPWFCEMNENRDDWECVQDEELARNPQPQRLPGDEEEDLIEADPIIAAPFIAPAVSLDELPDSSESEQPTETSAETSEAPSEVSTADLIESSSDVSIDAPTAMSINLLAQPAEHYAVQLIATANLDLAEQFTAEHSLDDTITVQLARDEELYVVVLLGVYSTYADAEAAVDGRGESLADIKPWIRPLESIQAGLEAAANLIAATDA